MKKSLKLRVSVWLCSNVTCFLNNFCFQHLPENQEFLVRLDFITAVNMKISHL
jgi:hypothetical protein